MRTVGLNSPPLMYPSSPRLTRSTRPVQYAGRAPASVGRTVAWSAERRSRSADTRSALAEIRASLLFAPAPANSTRESTLSSPTGRLSWPIGLMQPPPLRAQSASNLAQASSSPATRASWKSTSTASRTREWTVACERCSCSKRSSPTRLSGEPVAVNRLRPWVFSAAFRNWRTRWRRSASGSARLRASSSRCSRAALWASVWTLELASLVEASSTAARGLPGADCSKLTPQRLTASSLLPLACLDEDCAAACPWSAILFAHLWSSWCCACGRMESMGQAGSSVASRVFARA
mmetsp:Transcript_115857/g.369672  ORF Transcript_115857/g.369672 Transcript_115857/m.369672 type:complete len:292 (-) Transcript_115857:232-1107(-)